MTTHEDIAEFEKIASDTLSKLSSYLHEANQVGSPASGYAPMRELLQKLDIENYMQNGGMTRESFKGFLDEYLKSSVQLHSPSYIAHQVSVPRDKEKNACPKALISILGSLIWLKPGMR
jgi:L-2,4-diaminobutyrate decarboxylase